MKKLGFTLAEVMVALALIGVITSLTIPTFVASNKNRTHSAKAATTVSAVENAFTSMIAAEAVQDLSETKFAKDSNALNFGRYIKLSSFTNSMNTYYSEGTPFREIHNSNNTESEFGTPDIIFELKNGALVMFKKVAPTSIIQPEEEGAEPITLESLGGTISGSIGKLTIDVNGTDSPNIWGRDVFHFRIGNDGLLYPAGSLNYSILEKGDAKNLWNEEGDLSCMNNGNKTIGCCARLLENNYEVDF